MFNFKVSESWYKKAAESEKNMEISAGTLIPLEPVTEKEGSTYKVPLTTILEINVHPNAERLEVAKIYGFDVVIQKGVFKVGDTVLYIPVDSILPQRVEEFLFAPDAKIKLNKSRVRAAKIRGFVSQGMVVPLDEFFELFPLGKKHYDLEGDYSLGLGITKYQPPETAQPGPKTPRNKPKENPYFHKYGGLDSIKWYPELFTEGEEVIITEKIHGTNFRAGWVPSVPNTLWKKVKKFFGQLPEFEFVWGSNNVQLQERGKHTGFYEEDVYGKMVRKYDLRNVLKPGEVIYGEIYGPGIQKNYDYSAKDHELIVFDLKLQGKESSLFVDFDLMNEMLLGKSLRIVPVLYRGPYNKEMSKTLTEGPSVLDPNQKVREGIVIKPVKETETFMGRKVLKWVADSYLLDFNNTDNH